nr:ribonuclease H-like domain-containing protein [Tanacetum cinerariifolium]
ESSSSKPHDESSTQVPKGSGNPNLTASSSNPPADQMKTLTVESPIPTGIKREFSNARTLQQNGVAEKRNRTLIEVARIMLADAKLPVTFWAEAVNTACYVQNKGSLRQKGMKVTLLDTQCLAKHLVDAGTNSTNLSGTKDAANQEAKKDVSSLRYIVLPNWAHDAPLESSSSKPHDESSTQVFKGSGNPNLTASSSNPPADQIETLTVESPIPTVSSPVPTACLNDSPEPSSEARLISKTSPTPTLRIHKDHPKSQIIGPVDTPIQTRHKSKMMEEQSFIATIHQKTDQALL